MKIAALFIFGLLLIGSVNAQDNDDDSLLTDIVVGAGVALCEKNAICSSILVTIFWMFVVFNIYLCFIGEWEPPEIKPQKIIASGTSYMVTRALIN